MICTLSNAHGHPAARIEKLTQDSNNYKLRKKTNINFISNFTNIGSFIRNGYTRNWIS
jgi:hypothetical protein